MPKISKSKETNSDSAIVTAQCTSVLFITVFITQKPIYSSSTTYINIFYNKKSNRKSKVNGTKMKTKHLSFLKPD